MSLVSILPAAVEEAAAPSDFLLDTGWVGVTGTGAEVDLVTVTPTEDAQLFIYAKFYKNQINLSNFKLNIHKHSHDTGGAGIANGRQLSWRSPQGQGRYFSSHVMTKMQIFEGFNDSIYLTTNQASEANNQSCFFVEKDVLCKFQASSSFSSSYGFMYRIILKKSTSQNMVDVSQNR